MKSSAGAGVCMAVCHDGVRNCDRRDEAEGGGCGPRDSSADIRFITDGSGPDGLAWWSPASKSPERPRLLPAAPQAPPWPDPPGW